MPPGRSSPRKFRVRNRFNEFSSRLSTQGENDREGNAYGPKLLQVNVIQWKKVKFDPTVPYTPEKMATKFGMGDEVEDYYPCAKFHHYTIRGFRSDIWAMCCKVISSFEIFAVLYLRIGGCRP